jgi:hypothetical protein
MQYTLAIQFADKSEVFFMDAVRHKDKPLVMENSIQIIAHPVLVV